jgi:molybdate transport system ATP-binding protein
MSLAVRVKHRLGAFELDAAFTSHGGLTALFGASGSGKTSLLRLIAGLARPRDGRIVLDDTVLTDTAARRFVPPHRRGIGYVFQEARLLPHLSVQQNLDYGRRFALRRGAAVERARVVELLGIGALLQRAPSALSGGEAQRVAVGRALLSQPRLLLMDEPLAAIDELRKAEILPYLERLRDELRIPIVYVSHALDEIVRLATTLVVVDRGHVAAASALDAVLARVDLPILSRRNDAGVVLDARIAGHDEHWQLTTLHCQAGRLQVPRIDLPEGARLRLWVRARDVSLVSLAAAPLAATSILNVFDARVAELASGEGATTDVRLDCNGAPLLARITRLSAQRLALQPGSRVQALVKGVAFEHR